MLLRLDLKLRLGGQGWKETYWVDRSSATPENFRPTAAAFSRTRANILASSGEVQEISISNPALPFASVIDTTASQLSGKFLDEEQDVIDAAVLVRFRSGDGQRNRTLWLRGFPDDEIGFRGNSSDFTARDRELLGPFLKACIALPMVIHGQNPVGVPGQEATIEQIQPAPGGKRVAIKTTGHQLTGGEKITIRRSKFKFSDVDAKAINSTHLVIPTVAPLSVFDWFEINVAPGPLQIGDYLGQGKWTRRVLQTVLVEQAHAIKFASRSTGRVIVAQRGRRSAPRRFLPID